MKYADLLKSGKVFDASGISNPYAFDWQERQGVFYPVDFRVLSLYVFRSELGDCTAGGISSETGSVYVPCDSGPFMATKVDQDCILFPEKRGDEYWALKPAADDEKGSPCDGGNLAYSSDSRCRRVYHIHDRFETGIYDGR